MPLKGQKTTTGAKHISDLKELNFRKKGGAHKIDSKSVL